MRACIVLLLLPLLFANARAAGGGSYAAMLAYLTSSRIDGQALQGSSGAIAINIAAGDSNQQANLRALAVGQYAAVHVRSDQRQTGITANAPDASVASIGGQALDQATGLISINQASGTANVELNTASVVLAQQGTGAAPADQWLAGVCACKQQTTSAKAGPYGPGSQIYSAAVDAGAMQGVQGVVQLNQIAGSNNVTANQLTVETGVTPQ